MTSIASGRQARSLSGGGGVVYGATAAFAFARDAKTRPRAVAVRAARRKAGGELATGALLGGGIAYALDPPDWICRIFEGWARLVSNQRPLACEARVPHDPGRRTGYKFGINRRACQCRRIGLVGPNTAVFRPTNRPLARFASTTKKPQPRPLWSRSQSPMSGRRVTESPRAERARRRTPRRRVEDTVLNRVSALGDRRPRRWREAATSRLRQGESSPAGCGQAQDRKSRAHAAARPAFAHVRFQDQRS